MVRSGGRAAVGCGAVLMIIVLVLQATPSGAAARPRTTISKATRKATTTTTAKATALKVPTFAPATVAAVRAEADWALQSQLADGALGHYVDRVKVWPYLANFTAMGLSRATEVTGDRRYAQAAWRWLAWYQAHQDAQGFVTDYDVVAGVPTSTGDMDSTDAYAGTFLLAARRNWQATGDTATLRTLRTGIAGAVRAIEATQDVDGLTWAKPAWKVKYLMDQAETWAGLRAAVELAGVLGDSALRRRAETDAARMLTGINGMWNGGAGSYDWAIHADGARTPTRWGVLYSDALQQAWAVAFGVVPPARATALMARFTAEQPLWADPASLATFTGGTQRAGYWPVAGWAFLRIGDAARAATAATSIQGGALSASRAWPYTPANAGQLIGLVSADPRLLS